MKHALPVLLLLCPAFALAQPEPPPEPAQADPLVPMLDEAGCMKPDAPDIPDGDTSDIQTMVTGQKAVKGFVAGVEEYLDCLTAEEEAAGEEEEEATAQRIEVYNAAVDEMEQVAEALNVEIRKYKAKQAE